MTPTPANAPSLRPVAVWLWVLAAMIVVQVALGGITRLTDSGLSITEWKPLLGVLPPLDEASWQDAFAKYQQIPQFRQLAPHLSLSDFKFIYFWEWFHRLWGRLLGFAFLLPFLVFLRQGRLGGLAKRLLVIFALGGVQGLMGWVMVMSGLQDLVYVSHFRLAAHFLLAVLLLGAVVWLALSLGGPRRARTAAQEPVWRLAVGVLALLAVQLAWGAFVAGLKAVHVAPTWPTMNGAWLPVGGWAQDLGLWNLVNNPVTVVFVHRGLGYLVFLGVALLWLRLKAGGVGGRERHLPAVLATVQVVLGVLATLASIDAGAFLWLGVAHQVVAVLLTGALTATLWSLGRAAAGEARALPLGGAQRASMT